MVQAHKTYACEAVLLNLEGNSIEARSHTSQIDEVSAVRFCKAPSLSI